jgi:hypothetical protein
MHIAIKVKAEYTAHEQLLLVSYHTEGELDRMGLLLPADKLYVRTNIDTSYVKIVSNHFNDHDGWEQYNLEISTRIFLGFGFSEEKCPDPQISSSILWRQLIFIVDRLNQECSLSDKDLNLLSNMVPIKYWL